MIGPRPMKVHRYLHLRAAGDIVEKDCGDILADLHQRAGRCGKIGLKFNFLGNAKQLSLLLQGSEEFPKILV